MFFFSGTTVQKFLTTSVVREATLTRVPGREKVLIKRYPICLYSGRKAGLLVLFLNRGVLFTRTALGAAGVVTFPSLCRCGCPMASNLCRADIQTAVLLDALDNCPEGTTKENSRRLRSIVENAQV